MYGAAFELKAALDYDFEQERHFSYKNLTLEEIVKHITFFVSRLWQIHAFGEGNTRTTAVFTIKYLRSLGFNADNRIFAENSWYFRNALVHANYNNLQKGIHENPEFLEKFFRNLLLGEHNELKNRFLHIRAKDFLEIKKNDKNVTVNYGKVTENNKSVTQNITENNKNITVKLTQTQKDILNLIKENPHITQNEIASKLNIARETVNRNMKKLQQEKIIQRLGADKNGSWEILR